MGETEHLEDIGYLQDIISYVFDEKKIVTYKWISITLAVHVNRAKQLMYTFIKHMSDERLKELKVTYLVGGILADNKGYRILIVSEEDLEQVKAQFEIITSEHVYSVCFKSCLPDLHLLCSVDGVKDSKILRHGAVQCSNSVPRSTEEMASKRQGVYMASEDDKQWPAKQSKQQEKQPSTGNNDKKSSKAASSITAMFSAQSNKGKKENNTHSKKEEEKIESVSSSDKKPTETKNAGKSNKPATNRLAAMFSAQSSKPKPIKNNIQGNKSKNEEKVSAKEMPESPKNVIPEKNKDKVCKSPEDKSSKSQTSKIDKKKSKQKKRKAKDNKGDDNKKRKRIVIMDDSDSSSDEDIFGSEEDASPSPICIDEEEMEETVDTTKPLEETQSQEAVLKNSHHTRKRKLVDKTFVDDEGYVVTKKVYEYVSCSEGENEEKENEKSTVDKDNKKDSEPIDSKSDKKENVSVVKEVKEVQKTRKNSPQKKNSPPEKKKQATLMCFFKRS